MKRKFHTPEQIVKSTSIVNVKAYKSNSLQALTTTRPAGLEPATYGLERRWWAVVSPCTKSINNGHKKTYEINRRSAEDQP